MTFLFFSAANTPLFSRDDAESAEHTHEEMSLNALFPYHPDKVIERGMRIGYTDARGIFQAFEIRKAKTYEPDHYQELTAEHIAVAELTDEFFPATEWTNINARTALAALLTGTLWSVGNADAVLEDQLSSANVGNGNVWQDVRTIEQNWNVTITPRITVSASGITGRYLDITPAGGVWRGLRLSLEKNLDDAAVTWDDSNTKTALYGFGKSVEVSGQDDPQPLTFAEVVWTATADHPAKPAGQTYLEDPAATAAYGRNGRARFGFYQNGDISDAETLLEKTWETLKTCNFPDVSIDGTVRDLHRLGYTDVPLRLHDLALVEIRQTGVILQKEIIRYTEDLLNPLNSRVTIGTYIPNIVYINRETAKRASGGGGGSGGQTNAEYQVEEFYTQINANKYQISLKAAQVDLDSLDDRLTGEIQIEAGKITQIVTAVGSNGEVTAASICLAINNAGSSATINAENIMLNGNTIVTGTGNGLTAPNGEFTNLYAGPYSFVVEGSDIRAYNKIYAEGGIDALDGATIQASIGNFGILYADNDTTHAATWQSVTVRRYTLESAHWILYSGNPNNLTPIGATFGQIVTGYTDTTIYYLGHT